MSHICETLDLVFAEKLKEERKEEEMIKIPEEDMGGFLVNFGIKKVILLLLEGTKRDERRVIERWR